MAQKVLVWRASDKNEFTREDAKEQIEKNMEIAAPYKKIGSGAFKNNIKLRSILLGKSVEEVESNCFYNCTALRSACLEGVRLLKSSAFSGCVNLKTVMLPLTLEVIGEKAFFDCRRLTEFPLVTENGEACQKETGKLILPENLKKIGESAFLKCRSLEYVRLPEHIGVIGKNAFHGCSNLKILEIPGSSSIGDWLANKTTIIRCRRGGCVDEYCRTRGLHTEYLD